MSVDTLIIQSHRDPVPGDWLRFCMDSVRSWASQAGWDYRYLDDELFQPIPADLLDKCTARPVVASDLGRLYALRQGLTDGYSAVVWIDADVFVIESSALELPSDPYSLGREVWVEKDESGNLRTRVKVHNAGMVFRAGNSFLEFYLDTAERLLRRNTGSIAPQFLGPKLLTALHNVIGCPVWEQMAMLPPLVAADVLNGGGAALDLFNSKSMTPPAALNLCASLMAGRVAAGTGDELYMNGLVRHLAESSEQCFQIDSLL